MNLRNKSAIVTGASSGIGAATALALANNGCSVALAARRGEDLETLAERCRALGVKALAVRTDVRIREDCFRLASRAQEELGPTDVLVNNAGFAVFDTVIDANPDDIRAMLDTNYLGTVNCTQAVLPGMLSRRQGSIVNVASIAGIMGYAGMGLYGATKFAVLGFTESLRNEVIDQGIRVSAVCPGTTETEFFVTAEKGKAPAASRLILAIPPDRVARTIMKAIHTGRPRLIVPWQAALYMHFKELMPRPAHWLMRATSRALDRMDK